MWELTVMDVGSNRQHAIRLVRDLLGVTLAEARDKIDRGTDPLVAGDSDFLRPIKAGLEAAGIAVHTRLNVTDEEAADWACDELTADKRHCRHCGKKAFFMIPGKTTADSVQAFLQESGRCTESGTERIRAIHVGAYCPSGCFSVMVDYGAP